ncbi:MBL fold metallo-hydrolase [uncultured Boseongicola sp.]|jgi:glyoxylase-like metal-dependent hydrolase (beta-lactamase superfamily II)|uniref:MBL fold metallo-hydrolase n=1 Tax=uncultured Boseongicola sp. TaxID=1648499 RepID=UPI00260E06CD|nr:MBL fold metallo-hydrolase [uncultured Boseongicola sp.]
MRFHPLIRAAFICLIPGQVLAAALEVQRVTGGVWAIVGEMDQRSPENLANNATFGLVETEQGAVLIDPGGSWQGAEALADVIRGVTTQPVVYVIDTGGQDHRWLGNSYWQAQGATVIASDAAVKDQRARASLQLSGLASLLGDALEGTEASYADITFEERHAFSLGGVTFELIHAGAAHTPGDIFVWLPDQETVFTGDIVYVERVLGVGDQSSIGEWPAVFEAIAGLNPSHVVPGHGHATTLDHARADTYDYLTNLREKIGTLIDEGGSIMDAPTVDQSAFDYLEQFESLAGRNAQAAFQQMEWE